MLLLRQACHRQDDFLQPEVCYHRPALSATGSFPVTWRSTRGWPSCWSRSDSSLIMIWIMFRSGEVRFSNIFLTKKINLSNQNRNIECRVYFWDLYLLNCVGFVLFLTWADFQCCSRFQKTIYSLRGHKSPKNISKVQSKSLTHCKQWKLLNVFTD